MGVGYPPINQTIVAAALDQVSLGYLTGTKVYRFVTSGKLCFVRIGKSSPAYLDLGTTVLRALQNTTVLPALPYKAKLHTSPHVSNQK